MNSHGYINSNSSSNQYRYEYTYMKDDQLEGKDCILIKEDIFSLKNGKYTHINKIIPEKQLRAFWVEKSTGFVLGGSMIQPDNNTTITPEMIIKNISTGNVVDSDFDFPKDYEIIERE